MMAVARGFLYSLADAFKDTALEDALAGASIGYLLGVIVGGSAIAYAYDGPQAVVEFTGTAIMVVPLAAVLAVIAGGGIAYIKLTREQWKEGMTELKQRGKRQ